MQQKNIFVRFIQQRQGLLTGLCLFALLFLMTSCLEAGTFRSIKVKSQRSGTGGAPVLEEVDLYSDSYALVIGIDNYTQGWPRLSGAVKDAELVAEALEEKGFQVTLRTNLGSDDLKRAFEEFFILRGEDPQARLFVWFAGHGHTMNGEGFLVPSNAPRPEKGAMFRLKALSLRRFGEYVRLAQAKHAFTVFDACFSGTIFNTQRSLPSSAITRVTAMPVRQFLSSGDADQTVSDDGMFRKLFIRAIKGEEPGDANRDGYLTASELGLFITDRVTNLTRASQTPRYGKLRDSNYDRGDFVFLISPEEKISKREEGEKPYRPAAVTQGDPDLEALFWESVKESRNPASFEAYLARYPRGTFAPLAKIRLEEFRQNEASLKPGMIDKIKKRRFNRSGRIEKIFFKGGFVLVKMNRPDAVKKGDILLARNRKGKMVPMMAKKVNGRKVSAVAKRGLASLREDMVVWVKQGR